jgi:hypothetical protein
MFACLLFKAALLPRKCVVSVFSFSTYIKFTIMHENQKRFKKHL